MAARNREGPASRNALQQRLRELAGRYSLSEMARRTGAPLASVSRYFRGTRVPADFCGELAVHFGVNPVWLLTGEGPSRASEVPESTAAMAGDLLKLVEAMNSVAHMRLGALTGKHHLRILRELNEALRRFETLRSRLNDNAAPVLTRLLQDIEGAMNRTDVDQAADLHGTIAQVRRFCDDPELDYRAERACATYEMMRRNPGAALHHQQRVFMLAMGRGLLATPRELEETIRLAFLLSEAGREPEALHLCIAAMELAGPRGKDWENYPFLAFLTGYYMSNNLRLHEGIELMQRWQQQVQGPPRQRATRHMLAFALLYAGLIEPEEAFEVGGPSEVKAMNLLYYAAFRQDAAFLHSALKYLEGLGGAQKDLAPLGYVVEYARLLLEVQEGGRDVRSLKQIRRFLQLHPRASTHQELLVFETQLLLLTGRRKQALKLLHAAESAIAEPAQPARTLLLTRALHYRNALELNDKGLRREALAFFESHLAAGYRALHPGPALMPASAGRPS